MVKCNIAICNATFVRKGETCWQTTLPAGSTFAHHLPGPPSHEGQFAVSLCVWLRVALSDGSKRRMAPRVEVV